MSDDENNSSSNQPPLRRSSRLSGIPPEHVPDFNSSFSSSRLASSALPQASSAFPQASVIAINPIPQFLHADMPEVLEIRRQLLHSTNRLDSLAHNFQNLERHFGTHDDQFAESFDLIDETNRSSEVKFQHIASRLDSQEITAAHLASRLTSFHSDQQNQATSGNAPFSR